MPQFQAAAIIQLDGYEEALAAIIASVVGSSLEKPPPGYSPPLWRRIFMPASVLIQKYYGGFWISGDIHLTAKDVRFAPNRLSAKMYPASIAWVVPLESISDVKYKKGIAMDTIDIHHTRGVQTFKSVRTSDFIRRLEELTRRASPPPRD